LATSISSTVTGIAGFDVTAAVDGLLAFPKLSITRAEDKQTAETAKQDAFAAINDAMLAFKSTAMAMADSSKFFSYAASLTSSSAAVPSSSLLDVTGTDSVSAGKHSIVVKQIAQAERLSSSSAVKDSAGIAVTSDTTALGLVGSFNIGTTTVSVGGTDTLQDIAAAINQENTGASATGVSASVLKVAGGDYRLVLVSDTTGAAGFTLSGVALNTGGALANLQIGAATQATGGRQTLQTPQDSQVVIDGLTLSRSSNSISDALTGVTLNLKQADPLVTMTMDVSIDTAALNANVQAFVDAYNSVQSLVNEQFVFDPNTNTTGVLAGEPILTSIQSTLANSLIQSIPGLASDRSSMVMVGVEPDEKGQLTINPTLFDKFLTTDPTAIRDVFVANGSSTNNQLQFLTNGLNTPSGTYQVNVTQAASKASVLGSKDFSLGNLLANDTVTFTDSNSGRQAIVNLLALDTQASIISQLNTEFNKLTTEQHQLTGSLGATGVTTSSTLASLGFGVTAGDTISIGGTNRQGGAVAGSFSVLDPATDTVGTLLSAIQSTFNQQVTTSLDATGHIQVTDAQSGDSLLSISLTANNESGGTLTFGTDSVVTEGRYAMSLVAVAKGNSISVEAKAFGTSSNFSVAESATGANGLGLGTVTAGTSIAGTINGSTATGSGQLLIGNAGVVDGLGVFYTGTTTGAIGDINVGVGLGAKMEGILDLFSNPFTGLIQGTIASSQSTYDDLTKKINDLNVQLEQQRTMLTNSFTSMQTTMNTLQSTGDFLTAQVNAQNAKQ